MDSLRALSLTPPWPWAILRCGKRIENRQGWVIPAYKACREHRGTIALHASGLPRGVDSWWKRARLEPSYSPRASQRAALDEFEVLVDGCLVAARESGLHVEPLTLRELCAQTGHIVGTADVIGYADADRDDRPVVRIDGRPPRPMTQDERRFWMGGFALVLDHATELARPVPCKGALGLWPVPPDVLEQMGVDRG